MALDERIGARGAWSVTTPKSGDPAWCCARLTLHMEGGDVTLRLSPEEVGRMSKKLLAFAAQQLGRKLEDGFAPLRDLVDELNKLTGG
jgi:hypothetical protein